MDYAIEQEEFTATYERLLIERPCSILSEVETCEINRLNEGLFNHVLQVNKYVDEGTPYDVRAIRLYSQLMFHVLRKLSTEQIK